MCDPKAEQAASPSVLPRAPPSQPPLDAAAWMQRASRGLPPSNVIRNASGSRPAAWASSSMKLSVKKVIARCGWPRM